jgi:hypothetical protein
LTAAIDGAPARAGDTGGSPLNGSSTTNVAPRAGAWTRMRPRREERVEDLAPGLLRNPRPVVADLQGDRLPLMIVPRPDDHGAAAVRPDHRLFRIDHEVEQHLLDLLRIGKTWGSPEASAATTSILVTRCS